MLKLVEHAPNQIKETLNIEFPKFIQNIFNNPHVKISPAMKADIAENIAVKTLNEEFSKLETFEGMRREIQDALEDLESSDSESLTWRLSQATDASSKAQKSTLGEVQEEGEDKDAMAKFLQNLIDDEVWIKKNK
jgi:hypothetical protein